MVGPALQSKFVSCQVKFDAASGAGISDSVTVELTRDDDGNHLALVEKKRNMDPQNPKHRALTPPKKKYGRQQQLVMT